MKIRSITAAFFFFVSSVHLIGIFLENEILSSISKPFILIALMLYYLDATQLRNKTFLAALVFSFLGDVLLISNGETNFIFGLLSFLVAHILYIAIVVKQLGASSIKYKIGVIIPFVGLFFTLIFILKENLGAMLFPVVLYGLVISIFGVVSLLNYGIKKSKGALFLLVGALFFITSDSILAINKFQEPHELYPISIMFTYIIAQYLICRFVISISK